MAARWISSGIAPQVFGWTDAMDCEDLVGSGSNMEFPPVLGEVRFWRSLGVRKSPSA
jgi:hypothetical protein